MFEFGAKFGKHNIVRLDIWSLVEGVFFKFLEMDLRQKN